MLIYISTIYWCKIQTSIIYVLFLDGVTLDSDDYVIIFDDIDRDEGSMKLIL
jgi:peptidyl-tRNA hydrolase